MNAHLVSRANLIRTVAVAATSLALILTGAVPAQAGTPTLVDVPDAGLRSCLTRSLADADLPTDLTTENLGHLSTVFCNEQTDGPISDLTGMEYLTGLDKLSLPGSEVTDLAPMSGLTGLTQLFLETSGTVDTAPLANLTALYSLKLRAPKVTDVSFLSSLGSLDLLELGISPKASLAPVSSVSSLTRFSLRTTDSVLPSVTLPSGVIGLQIWAPALTSFANLPDAASVLTLIVSHSPDLADLSGIASLSGLQKLYLSSGSYSAVTPLAQLSALENLSATDAAIKDLTPLASLTSVKSIDLRNNHITDVTPLGGLPNLVALDLSDNRLSTLGSAGSLAQLTSIDASNNKLTSIDALSGARLRYAWLSGNQLTNVKALSSAAAGATIDLRENAIRDFSPLPDDAKVDAQGQAPLNPASAIVGTAFDLGLRDIAGKSLCPIYYSDDVRCKNGAVTYLRAGTYVGHVRLATGSSIFTVTQHADLGARLTRTYAPRVSGRPVVGRKLSASVKAWSPQVSFTYRWYRNGMAISVESGTGRVYRVTAADHEQRLSVCVTGHRDGYRDARRCSTRTKRVVEGKITRAPRPKVSPHRKVSVGTKLSARTGRWQAGVKLHYQWLRNGRPIKGAKASTYRVHRHDRHDRISVRVKGTKAGFIVKQRTSKTIRIR